MKPGPAASTEENQLPSSSMLAMRASAIFLGAMCSCFAPAMAWLAAKSPLRLSLGISTVPDSSAPAGSSPAWEAFW